MIVQQSKCVFCEHGLLQWAMTQVKLPMSQLLLAKLACNVVTNAAFFTTLLVAMRGLFGHVTQNVQLVVKKGQLAQTIPCAWAHPSIASGALPLQPAPC